MEGERERARDQTDWMERRKEEESGPSLERS